MADYDLSHVLAVSNWFMLSLKTDRPCPRPVLGPKTVLFCLVKKSTNVEYKLVFVEQGLLLSGYSCFTIPKLMLVVNCAPAQDMSENTFLKCLAAKNITI